MRRDYGRDVLAEGGRKPRRPAVPQVEAERGLVVESRGRRVLRGRGPAARSWA